jgi:hypothetical protein
VWSLELEKLEYLLYHLNSMHCGIKFTVETERYSEPPSCMFVFIGDLMAVCFRRITVSHPWELLSHLWLTQPHFQHTYSVVFLQGVRALYEWVQPETDLSDCLHWRGHEAPGRYNHVRIPAYVCMTFNHMSRMLSRHKIKCRGLFNMTNIS